MSTISTYLEYIRSKVYAKDVRTAIVNAISQCYDDVNAPALQTEAMQAAVQAKIDAGEMAALTIADGSLTGAKLADETIPSAKIADGAVTAGKIASGVVPPVDATLTQAGAIADAKAAGDRLTAVEVDSVLLTDEIPNTVQTYTFANGQVSQIVHKRNNSTIRTDAFTYSAAAIVETRTLNTGAVLAISTNLSTLETSVTYTAA